MFNPMCVSKDDFEWNAMVIVHPDGMWRDAEEGPEESFEPIYDDVSYEEVPRWAFDLWDDDPIDHYLTHVLGF